MLTALLALAALSILPSATDATTATRSTPQLHYTLRVDPRDTTAIAVELSIRNAPQSMVLAAHAHPEYDDKYWRFVEGLTARTARGDAVTVTRTDSVRWAVNNAVGDVAISWRVRLPREDGQRSAWLPFVTANGGLVGGPHSFLYITGLEQAPARVTLDLPRDWKVGTGLPGASTAREFHARDMHTLMESPMLVGRMSEWSFRVQGTPHRVFYWRAPGSVAFDTVTFVQNIERLATETVKLFGSMPYDAYTFLFQDGAWGGGLEHPNSVTLGAPSSELARNVSSGLSELAHEFVHTWNLMAITPIEYRKVDYRVQPPVSGLWFSEGLTIFYADLLRRRAGLPTADSTRTAHLADLVTWYLSQPGNARYSAEAVSRVAYNASPDALGDYSASSHLQGELLGTMLDIRVRDRTDGRKSMDDVMRTMFAQHRTRGFTGSDIERVVTAECACRVADIFDRHVRNGNPIDFNSVLAPIGLQLDTVWSPAVGANGTPTKDLRMWGWTDASDSTLRLRITDPSSVFGKAGLRTGDRLIAINGVPKRTWPELRAFLVTFAIGDSATFTVRRGTAPQSAPQNMRVVMQQLVAPRVEIGSIPSATERQRRLREQWMQGR